MILELVRLGHGIDSTLGSLLVNGGLFAFTIEDEFRLEKVSGETRIPAGTYSIDLRREGGMLKKYKAKFSDMDHPGMIELQDVPGFKYVYLHYGNYESNTKGCILVNNAAFIDRIDGGGHGGDSVNCYRSLYPLIRDELSGGNSVQIIIRDHCGV